MIPAAFIGLFVLLVALAFTMLMRHFGVTLDPQLPPIPDIMPRRQAALPEPEWDPVAFWLFPDWEKAGDQAFWMVPPKKPLESMSEYERGVAAGRELYDRIEALAVDRATKDRMRRELALQLQGQQSSQPQALLPSGVAGHESSVIRYRVFTHSSGGY